MEDAKEVVGPPWSRLGAGIQSKEGVVPKGGVVRVREGVGVVVAPAACVLPAGQEGWVAAVGGEG